MPSMGTSGWMSVRAIVAIASVAGDGVRVRVRVRVGVRVGVRVRVTVRVRVRVRVERRYGMLKRSAFRLPSASSAGIWLGVGLGLGSGLAPV